MHAIESIAYHTYAPEELLGALKAPTAAAHHVLTEREMAGLYPDGFPARRDDAQQGCTYTVIGGDTLSAIASKTGVTLEKLIELNGIADPNLIHPGRKLTTCRQADSPPSVPTRAIPTPPDRPTVRLSSPAESAPGPASAAAVRRPPFYDSLSPKEEALLTCRPLSAVTALRSRRPPPAVVPPTTITAKCEVKSGFFGKRVNLVVSADGQRSNILTPYFIDTLHEYNDARSPYKYVVTRVLVKYGDDAFPVTITSYLQADRDWFLGIPLNTYTLHTCTVAAVFPPCRTPSD